MEMYIEQCKKYVYKKFRIDSDDVVQEMLTLIWQSYVNGNGMSKVIAEQKLIPSWQLHLLFLNALRNLNLISDSDTETFHHPWPARVIKDENGEIIDFYYPEEIEETEERKSKVPTGREKERWLEKIRRLMGKGYSSEEIVEMLKPSRQEVLF